MRLAARRDQLVAVYVARIASPSPVDDAADKEPRKPRSIPGSRFGDFKIDGFRFHYNDRSTTGVPRSAGVSGVVTEPCSHFPSSRRQRLLTPELSRA